jgi:hypothetical protein
VAESADREESVLDRWLGRALPFAPVAIATFWLARTTTRVILAKTVEPAVPLDDAFIHFQYARSLAEGRFFAFVPGEGYSSGATSLLWPAALAPFYLLGLRDTSIIWAAWILGFAFLALLAVETKRLAAPLVGDISAMAAGAGVLAFGGYTWFAASGMEVTPLAWTLAITARLASTWAERPNERTDSLRRKLLALAVAGPLVRPEGMLASVMVLGTLFVFPTRFVVADRAQRIRARSFALLALLGPLLPPLLNKLLTGQFSTSTTQVKWLALNPYYGGPAFFTGVKANLEIFFRTLLDGKEWSAIFIPPSSMPIAIAAVAAIPFAGFRARKPWRTLLVVMLAAGMLIPTTYLSFLWNRLRYLWPFAFAWIIGLACLARVLADVLALLRPRFAGTAPILAGAAVGFLGHHLSWSMDDVAQSAAAIHNQQVRLGRWASEHLPETARIGVNDTGAIAYLSHRKTFDVVGLTTPAEARYWVAGPGSRYEHYERLHTLHRETLPTHFIVYPHWMACDPVLGKELTRATVTDQTILGGATMVAYEARYDTLHTGDLPLEPPAGSLVDELDVSDLESESAHRFDVLGGGGTDTDNLVHSTRDDLHLEHVDAGRAQRTADRFVLRIPARGKLVGRFASSAGTRLTVRIGSKTETLDLPPDDWTERTLDVEGTGDLQPVEITSTSDRTFTSMHYWTFAP